MTIYKHLFLYIQINVVFSSPLINKTSLCNRWRHLQKITTGQNPELWKGGGLPPGHPTFRHMLWALCDREMGKIETWNSGERQTWRWDSGTRLRLGWCQADVIATWSHSAVQIRAAAEDQGWVHGATTAGYVDVCILCYHWRTHNICGLCCSLKPRWLMPVDQAAIWGLGNVCGLWAFCSGGPCLWSMLPSETIWKLMIGASVDCKQQEAIFAVMLMIVNT